MRLLESYDWPGNVRELENMIERALALSPGAVIDASDLPQQVRTGSERASQSIMLPKEGSTSRPTSRVRKRPDAQALERTDGVQTQAAELLNMSFRSFRYYAKKVGITARRDGTATTSTTRWTSSRRRGLPVWWVAR